MDNLLLKERDKVDKVSRDALEQLLFKDQIIEELRSKLSKEQLDNITLKTKIKELDDKISFFEEKLEKEENSSIQNRTQNLNPFNNNNKTSDNYNKEDIERLKNEKQELLLKFQIILAELESWKDKSKSISEIEEIYKFQIEQLKKKTDNSEFLQKKLKEKENYIEEIINRYNNLQNEFENMLNNKDYEIKELKTKQNFLTENNEKFTQQINTLSQNSNNVSQELYKELQILNEKNKDLELKLLKTEQKYKDEVIGLKKILEDSTKAESNNNLKKENVNGNKHDSTSMRVEDLATSLSKSIKEKIENQNKKISSQNIEILSLQYELEKLKSDIKYEKELNENLQSALADLKCKNLQSFHNNRVCYEEAQTQTYLKAEDLESFKIKAKILEDNLIKTSEDYELTQKKIKILKEQITKISKENKDKEKEILQLVKKIEKLQQGDRSLERELASVNNISKLNMTVSALKMREDELLERLQNYETEKDKNQEKLIYQPSNFSATNIKYNNISYNPPNPPSDSQNNSLIGGYNSNLNNFQKNSLNNFNKNNFTNYNQNNFSNTNKDILVEKYELDLKRLQEDNFFLKDQNFRLVSESNKYNEYANSYKFQISDLQSEKENLINQKLQLRDEYEKIISDLKENLEKSKNLNNDKIDEMRINLQTISDMNTKLSDQFNSLQNKFYVQTQLIQEKNIELTSERNLIENLKKDNEELIENQTKLVEKLKSLEKQNLINLSDKEKLKKELSDIKNNFEDFNLKINFSKSDLEERTKILQEENLKLKETNTELKSKMRDIYDDIKAKDNKIINVLKEEGRDTENKMRNEINDLRIEIEQLMKERSAIRLQFNELKYENDLLKEQININKPNCLILNNKINNLNNSNLVSNNSLNPPNNVNNSFMSYLTPGFNQNNSDPNKIKQNILNQNNNHFKEILNNNKSLEQENDFIKNENSKIQSELESLSKKYIQIENTLKDIKLDYDADLVEKDKLADLLHRKELENKEINLEVRTLQNEINSFRKKIEDYVIEINVKNQTINKLLDNMENEKNLNYKNFSEIEETLHIINNEKLTLKDKLDNLTDLLDEEKLKYKSNLQDLRKENEILIQDLEKKENDIQVAGDANLIEISELKNLIDSNKNFIELITKENAQLKEDNKILETQVCDLSMLSLERLEKQNEKIMKSKNKQEKLVELYETHIKFLKDRFDSRLNDLVLLVNFKHGLLNEKDADKFKAIVKNLENTSEMINQIEGRDALIKNNKEEIKNLKQNLNKTKENLKKILKEKDDLQEILNVKKLQKKIPENSNKLNSSGNNQENFNNCKNCIQKNVKIDNLLKEITDIKIDEREIDLNIISLKSQINKLEDINRDLNEKYQINVQNTENIRGEQIKKEKELLDANKILKSEMGKIQEELKRIREKWINPEKYKEKVEDLETKSKNLKNETIRKNDQINSLKTELSLLQLQIQNLGCNVNSTNSLNQNINKNNQDSSVIVFEEKIKSLQKELNRKDTVIKEFKTNLEAVRNLEKKLSEENSNFVEKNKILKIDIGRKDEIIKDYKEKYNLLNLTNKNNPDGKLVQDTSKTNNNSSNDTSYLNSIIKKLKCDIERKDDIIKTLKLKLENSNNEIEQIKTLNIKTSKNNYTDFEKEQKKNENLRNKIDSLLIKNENLISVIRRVFKDLIFAYEKNSIKSKIENLDKSSQNYKDGMDILNIAPDELEDYLNPDDNLNLNNQTLKSNLKNTKNMYEKINSLLDSDNIESDAFIDIFYSIKDKIYNNVNEKLNKDLSKTILNKKCNSNLFQNDSSPCFNKQNSFSNLNALNYTNFTSNIKQKSGLENSFQTPSSIEHEPKLKKYQNLLNRVKGNENDSTNNYNISTDNGNFDGFMNELQKMKK